jgi:hypothetical protein
MAHEIGTNTPSKQRPKIVHLGSGRAWGGSTMKFTDSALDIAIGKVTTMTEVIKPGKLI